MTQNAAPFKYLLLLTTLLVASAGWAQIPPGYYDDAEGLTGQPLRQALHQVIDNHNSISYDAIWEKFEWTDQKSNGKVWDIYSDQPNGTPAYEYNFGVDQCGQYGGESDCYNREHSFPQSWYGGGSPMKTDMFHVYPTDGYVNGKRSSYPFGTVGSSTWTASNGTELGYSNWPGYSGIVLEPIDEYKGDLARSYFYMLTRYKPQIANWSSEMLQDSDFSDWAVDLLLDWAQNDPVSQKEIDRNNEIYVFQQNRNPFIDRPEFAEEVWESPTSTNEMDEENIEIILVQGQLILPQDASIENLYLFNSSGQQITQWSNPQSTVALPEIKSKGLYFAVAQSENGVGVLRFVETGR